MDISTGNWFNYLKDNVLTEGLRDIGLPEFVATTETRCGTSSAHVHRDHWKQSAAEWLVV